MARMKTYRLDRVLVERGEAHAAQWTFAGESMSGTEQWYGVTDGNYPRNNAWEFVLRMPKAAGDRIEVRPRSTPEGQGVVGTDRPLADLHAGHDVRRPAESATARSRWPTPAAKRPRTWCAPTSGTSSPSGSTP